MQSLSGWVPPSNISTCHIHGQTLEYRNKCVICVQVSNLYCISTIRPNITRASICEYEKNCGNRCEICYEPFQELTADSWMNRISKSIYLRDPSLGCISTNVALAHFKCAKLIGFGKTRDQNLKRFLNWNKMNPAGLELTRAVDAASIQKYYPTIRRMSFAAGRETDITPKWMVESYIAARGRCTYCAVKLRLTSKNNCDPKKISWDRLDNHIKEYTTANTRIVCWGCNKYKNEFSIHEITKLWEHVSGLQITVPTAVSASHQDVDMEIRELTSFQSKKPDVMILPPPSDAERLEYIKLTHRISEDPTKHHKVHAKKTPKVKPYVMVV